MKKYTILVLIACLICGRALANELVVTFKPSSGLAGTTALNFHQDGKITLLIYESVTRITENAINMKEDDIVTVKKLAERTLNEYLSREQFKELKTYQLTAGIAYKVDAVTKSISTRKLTGNMIKLIKQVNQYIPEKFRLQVIEKKSGH